MNKILDKLNFEEKILETFKENSIIPRIGQVQAVDKILTAFFINENKRVILNAPTGYGKSVIAIIVSKMVSKMVNKNKFGVNGDEFIPANSVILMHTNMLIEQYKNSFEKILGFEIVKGAANYKCSLLGTDASSCCKYALEQQLKSKKCENTDSIISNISSNCANCEYKLSRSSNVKAEILCTNNAYHIIMQLYGLTKTTHPEQLYPTRDLAIIDEAHVLNDSFISHMQIHITKENLKKIHTECAELEILPEEYLANNLNELVLKYDDINQTNYEGYVSKLYKYYKTISDMYLKKASVFLAENNFKNYSKYNSKYKKYFGLGCKIDDLQKYKYEHIFDKTDNEINIKPIFIRDLLFKHIIHSEYQLFMSATIEPMLTKYVFGTANFEYIKLDPIFKPEQKKITFFNFGKLNYSNMEKNTEELSRCCEEIILHNNENKGIILTPSFMVTSNISKYLKSKKSFKSRIIEHKQGENLIDVISEHKKSKLNSIIITPSGFEGLDLVDDLSRFQIIVKAPYFSLGDKRIKYILDRYPKVYSLMTLYKIIQGMGRSTRNETDFSHTYCLDSNIQKLFNSNQNIWANEFDY